MGDMGTEKSATITNEIVTISRRESALIKSSIFDYREQCEKCFYFYVVATSEISRENSSACLVNI